MTPHLIPDEGVPVPSGEVALVEPARELRGFPLGTILLRLGFVAEGPINEALAECERARKPLGRFLVERGELQEGELARALANQKGLPYVEIESVTPDRRALSLLSAHAANTLCALPLGYAGEVPIVAVGDVTNHETLDEIRSLAGGDIVLAAAVPGKLREAIRGAYRPVEAPAPGPAQVVPIAPPAPTPPPPAPVPAPVPDVQPTGTVAVVATTVAGRIELERCGTRDAAHRRAQELARELADGGWVSSGGRLLRSDAIVAIELVDAS